VAGCVMESQAAASHVLVVLGIAVDAWVEAPALLASVGIQRNGDAVGSADEQAIADLQRRNLIGDFARIAFARQITGVIFPGLLQGPDIFRRDEVSRGIAV